MISLTIRTPPYHSKSKPITKSSSKEPAGTSKDISMVRTAGAGGVTEEVTDKGGVLYAKKENSDCCRDCGMVFAIGNSNVKALVKLGRYV
jgi:hypothetical protein